MKMSIAAHIDSGKVVKPVPRDRGPIAFDRINEAGLANVMSILQRWLPGGRIEGAEYTARNPRRADRRHGSFKVNIRTGKWSDFATGDRGGDLVSLAAYLAGISQGEAGRRMGGMLGVEIHE
jgi:hypothetical protein